MIFGYPGATIIDIQHYLEESGLRFVLVRHEQAAVHAADGYARVSGKPGVVLVTGGPGATNTVTGIAGANMDSIPIVVFTGQVPRLLIGNDAFQEVDTVGITRPISKHNYLVKSVESLAATVKEAFYLAASGRPGPVVVDLPKDVIKGEAEFEYPRQRVRLRAYQPHTEPHHLQVERAADLLMKAERPVIYAGGGVILARAEQELLALAERLNIPVTLTLMGLGAFPGDHPLFLGMLGMHGLYAANMAISQADVVLAVGARFDDRVTGRLDDFCPGAKFIQIDIDPTSIHKTVSVDFPMVADAQKALAAMLKAVDEKPPAGEKPGREAWLGEIAVWAQEHPPRYRQDPQGPIKPQLVVEELYRATRGEAVITTEVGQHQMWAAQFYKVLKPRHFITSGGLGVMGFGLPAAIGAQVARPEALVIDIAGDGSILMNIQELATAAEENLPVKVAVINNGSLGMVRQWQHLFYGQRYAATVFRFQPDFVKLAEAFGWAGFRADAPGQVAEVVKRGLAAPGPALMEFVVEPGECVYPMVPAGKGLTEMLVTSQWPA